MPKERYKIVPAVYLILTKGKKILLSRRFNTHYEDGNYGLISGHVEEDETYTQGIIREAQEEACITIKPEELNVVHVMHTSSAVNGSYARLDVFFTTAKWSGKIINGEPHKCDDLSWFDRDNLPQNTIPYIKCALAHTTAGVYYSEFGW